MTIRDIAIAFGYEVDQKSEKKVEKSVKDLKNMAKSAFRAIGLGLSLVKANALVEEFTQVNQQLKNAVGEAENFADVQDKILQSANDARLSYAGMSTYVKGLMNSQNTLFGTVEKTAEFAELTTKAFKAAGANESTINSLNNGIKSAFTTGKVSAGTFQQLMESCPDSVEYLAEMLGISERQVKALGTAGAITSNQLYSAFAKNAGAIEKSFENTAFTITDAITNIKNKFGTWLYQFNDTLKITHTISKVMTRAFSVIHGALKKVTAFVEKMNNKLGGAEKTLKLIAAAGASLFVALKGAKILAFFKSLGVLLKGGSLKFLLIAAAILAVVMIVEDFISFLKGNDSMFGELLTSLGIDADKTRESIKKFIGLVVDAAKAVIPALTKAVKFCVNALAKLVGFVGKAIAFFKEHKVLAQILAAVIGTLTAAIIAYNIAQAIKNAGGIIELAQLAALAIGIGALTVAQTAHTIATTIATAATTAFGVAMAFLTSPITLVVLAIGALIAIIVLCVKYWDNIKAAALSAWEWIKGVWSSVANWFNENIIQPVVGFFKGLWEKVTGIFQSIIDWVKTNWQSIVAFFINPFAGIFKYLYDNFEGFRNFVDNIAQKIKEYFLSAFEGIMNVFGKVGDFFKGIFGGNKVEMKGVAESVLNMGTPSAASGVLNNSTSNRTLTQNVTITNSFSGGSADQQKNGAKAMKNSANDATGMMARGLAFAR